MPPCARSRRTATARVTRCGSAGRPRQPSTASCSTSTAPTEPLSARARSPRSPPGPTPGTGTGRSAGPRSTTGRTCCSWSGRRRARPTARHPPVPPPRPRSRSTGSPSTPPIRCSRPPRRRPPLISPNGDGTRDSVAYALTATGATRWVVRVTNAAGATVRSATGAGARAAFTWAGTERQGRTGARRAVHGNPHRRGRRRQHREPVLRGRRGHHGSRREADKLAGRLLSEPRRHRRHDGPRLDGVREGDRHRPDLPGHHPRPLVDGHRPYGVVGQVGRTHGIAGPPWRTAATPSA